MTRAVMLAVIAALAPRHAVAAEGVPNRPASSISKLECSDAFEQSQRLRNSADYLEAAGQALRCASDACGAFLSEECGRLYGEIQAATPSVVLAARSADGAELQNVSVTLDGGSSSLPLDGKPLLVNPGHHEFVFEARGREPSKLTTTILAGERFRPIIAVLAEKAPPQPPPSERGEAASGRAQHGRIPVASYVLGGIGVAGLAGFVGFRIAGANDYAALERDCKPTCTQSSVDAVRQKYVLSYTSLAIGAAASIAAVTFYFAAPSQPSQQAATLQIRQVSSGLTAHLDLRF